MRNICLSLLFFFPIAGFCQAKTRKVVQLYPQQNFYLNGGTRALFGAVSRQSYNIVLPSGTVEWYYTITTAKGTPNEAINLAPQLVKLIDPSGITSIAVSAILAPTGAGVVDAYLFLPQYNNAFTAKTNFTYFTFNSRQNFRSGTIQVRDVISPGTYILGFRNPSANEGIGVSFEAVAIVEETTGSENVSNDNTSKAIEYGNIGWRSYQAGDIEKCIEYSMKALSLNSGLGYVKANLGLCYLIKQDQSTSTDYYIDALSDFKKITDKAQRSVAINGALKDIKDLLKTNPSVKGVEQIKSMYNDALLQSILK